MAEFSSEEEGSDRYTQDPDSATHVSAMSASDQAYVAEQVALIKQIDEARAPMTLWEQFRADYYPPPGKWHTACGVRFRSSQFLWAVEADFLKATPGQFIDAWSEEYIALNNEPWLGPYCRIRMYAFVRFHTQSAKRADDYLYHHYRQGRTNKERSEYRADIQSMSDSWPNAGPWNREGKPDDLAFTCDLRATPPNCSDPGQWSYVDSTARTASPEEARCFKGGAKPRRDERFGGALMHAQTGWS